MNPFRHLFPTKPAAPTPPSAVPVLSDLVKGIVKSLQTEHDQWSCVRPLVSKQVVSVQTEWSRLPTYTHSATSLQIRCNINVVPPSAFLPVSPDSTYEAVLSIGERQAIRDALQAWELARATAIFGPKSKSFEDLGKSSAESA